MLLLKVCHDAVNILLPLPLLQLRRTPIPNGQSALLWARKGDLMSNLALATLRASRPRPPKLDLLTRQMIYFTGLCPSMQA